MQEQQTGQEQIPDKFYFNEVKREVVAASAEHDLMDDYNALGEFVDLGELRSVIKQGTNNYQDTNKIINDNHELVQGLWGYLGDRYENALDVKGYASDDIRAGAVALCSAYIRLSRAVDVAKRLEIGDGGHTEFSNAMLSSVIMSGARVMAAKDDKLFTDQTIGFVSKLSSEAFKRVQYEKGNVSWNWAKVHTVAEALKTAFTARDVLKGLPELGVADTEMLKRQNDQMIEASMSLRTYTPKPAVGELEGTDLSTLFVDGEVGGHFVTGEKSATINHVKVFKGTSLDSSNVVMDYANAYKNNGGRAKRVGLEGADSDIAYADIAIYNGELTILGVKLADFAHGMQLDGQAELLRSMILAQNFDLTVPSYVVELTNEEAAAEDADPGSNPLADKMRRLMIARIRALNSLGDGIAEELAKEDSEVAGKHKDIIKHGVVGHLRRLPAGYTAGQDAKKLCREQLGVELPDGHTYVQLHERGNIEAPHRGHKLETVRHAGRVSVSGKK